MSTQSVIQSCAALYGIVPGAAGVDFVNGQVGTGKAFATEDAMLNHYYEAVFTVWVPKTTAQVAAMIVSNLGITGADAATETTRIAGELDAVALNARGAKVKEIVTAFEAGGSEAAAAFTALTANLVTAVGDPDYQGITDKGVGELVFSSLKAANITMGTSATVSEIALTTSADAITGTAAVDLISGEVSGLSASRTLSPTDTIDGGDGEDQASITMNGAFAGFGSTGSMTNVEKLVLTNGSVIARSFDATGITGVTSIVLDSSKGVLSLTNLPETGVSVAVVGQASGDLDVGFKTTTATDDAVTVKLGGGIGSTSAVSLNSAGIENVFVQSSGSSANKFEIGDGSTGVKTVTVSGGQDLTLTRDAAAAAITTVDASAATGSMTITNGTTAGLTSVKGSATATNTISVTATTGTLASVVGGAANDSFTVASSTLRADATVTGGDGTDSLSLSSGAARTLQVTMSGVETLSVGALSGSLTFDGAKVEGLGTLSIGAVSSNVSMTNMAQADLAVALTNAASNTSGATVSVDNTGVLTGTLTSSSTTAALTSNVGLTASKATDVTFNAGTGVAYQGTITATKATAVTLTSDAATTLASGLGTGATAGTTQMTLSAPLAEVINVNSNAQLNLDITAAKATSASITHAGSSNAVVRFSQGVTSALEQLTVSSAKPMDFTGSDFSVVQILNASGSEGALTLPALPKLITGTFSGTGTTSAKESSLTLGNITSEALDLTISGFKGGGTVGTISGTASAALDLDALSSSTTMVIGTIASGSGTVNVSAAGSTTPKLTTGAITASTTATINMKQATTGSYVGDGTDTAGTADITAKTIDYTGPFTIGSNITATTAATSGAFNVTVNGGLSADTFHVKGTAGLTSIVVSGDLSISDAATYDRVFITPAASSASAVTIDARGITGTLATTQVVIGSADGTTLLNKPSVIYGSAYNDFIVVPTGTTTIAGGAGEDVFHFPDGSNFALSGAPTFGSGTASYTLGSNAVVISDFNTGKDLISFAGEAGSTAFTIYTTAAPTALPTNASSAGHVIPGSYVASTKVFTYSATGAQSLLIYEDDSGDEYAAVLDAYTHTAAKEGSADAVTVAPDVTGSVNVNFTGLLGVA